MGNAPPGGGVSSRGYHKSHSDPLRDNRGLRYLGHMLSATVRGLHTNQAQANDERQFATQEQLRQRFSKISTFTRCLTAPPGTESIGYEPNSSGQYLEYLARTRGMEPTHQDKAPPSSFRYWRRKFCNQGHMRWWLLIMTGLCTAFVAVAVELGMEHLYELRMTLNDMVVDSGAGIAPQYLAFEAVCLAFAGIAAGLVCFVEDLAAGSGIPEIKCYLNGIALPNVVGPKALLAKAVGIVFSVSAGLPCGKEGPMIHSGAIVGATMSEARWGLVKPFRLAAEQRDFVAAGAAAGVAAAFGAPFGSVLFAVEEGASHMNSIILLKLFVASGVATLIVKLCSAGFATEDIHIPWGRLGARVPVSFGSFKGAESGALDYELVELPIFALLAAISGLMGAFFNAANKKLTMWRSSHVGKRGCRRFVEALLVTFFITSVSFWVPILLSGGKRKKLHDLREAEALFWNPGAGNLKALFHHNRSDFDAWITISFMLFNYTMSCWTYGLGVPSGLFVPSLLTGAAFGRVVGQLMQMVPPGSASRPWASPSLYALVGAASMLAGTARITISLAMILLEVTGTSGFALPLFLAVMVAKWTGDHFTRGIYDMHIIELKHVPLLEVLPEKVMDFMQVRDVMSENAITFQQEETVCNVVQKLNSCTHNGFPVCYENMEFCGVIQRHTLNAVLNMGEEYGVFIDEEPEHARQTSTEHARQTSRDSRDSVIPFDKVPWHKMKVAKYKDIYRFAPSDPRCTDRRTVDLRPYINRNGYVIPAHAPLSSCYVLIRQVGIRHLPVVSRGMIVVGIVTRKDMILVEDKCGEEDSEDESETESEHDNSECEGDADEERALELPQGKSRASVKSVKSAKSAKSVKSVKGGIWQLSWQQSPDCPSE